MIIYSITSWFSVILVFFGLGFLFFKKKHSFVRPTVITLIFVWLRIQIPAAYFSDRIYSYLPDPWEYYLYCHLIPLLMLIGIFITRNYSARRISINVLFPIYVAKYHSSYSQLNRLMVILLILQFIIVLFYLANVPFISTGLYSLLFDPTSYTDARQNSLRLVTNPLVTYSYSWARDIIGPLAAALVWYKASIDGYKNGIVRYTTILILLMFSVSMTGARAAPASIILIMILVSWFNNGMKFGLTKSVASFILILTFPVIITLLRGGEDLSFNLYIKFLVGPIMGRFFETPMETTLYYAHYIQTNGALGIAGFRPLANAFGESFINLPNIIGLTYFNSRVESVSANSSFIFDLYAIFGNGFGIFAAILLWCILDFFLISFRRQSLVNLPIITVLWLKCMFFMSSAYFTNLFTHGFILLFLIALWVNTRIVINKSLITE